MGRFQDLTGSKYGRLTVVERAVIPNDKKTYWKCRCDCGNEAVVPTGDIKSGKVKSCGCLKRERELSQTEDLIGQTFGKLTVIESAPPVYYPNGQRKAVWVCRCECGATTTAKADVLKAGRKFSCGCIGRFDCLEFHHSIDRLYAIWSAMKQRCNNPNSEQYSNYGGRGIRVCQEWDNSYLSFKEWAIVNGYDPEAEHGKCTIDRINVDGNYEPGNCRWVDMKVQANNTRKAIKSRAKKNQQ